MPALREFASRVKGRDRRVRERVRAGVAMARFENSREAGMADGPGQPGPHPREGVPRPQRPAAGAVEAGAIACGAGCGGRRVGIAADPQDVLVRLRRQGPGSAFPRHPRRCRPGARLGLVDCVAEAVVAFAAEVSVIVARGEDGDSTTFPACWNRHDRHILDTSVAPAPIGPIASMEARDLALSVAEALGTVGRFDRRILPRGRRLAPGQRNRPPVLTIPGTGRSRPLPRASSSSRSARSADSRSARRT